MRLNRIVGVFGVSLLVGVYSGIGFVACAGKVTGATPIASAAIKADAVVIRVNELQNAAMAACGTPSGDCQPGGISRALAVEIVADCVSLNQVLRTVPAGWQASVKASWAQAKARIGVVSNPAVAAALGVLDGLIGGL